jgi:drug/metabolite transporter (DMT)-like permease
MELSGFSQVFAAGCFGGILVEAVKLYNYREKARMPFYFKYPRYWIITFVMVLCAGAFSTFYGVGSVNGLLAVHIGASAPLIISSLAKTVPTTASPPSLRGGKSERDVSLPSVLEVIAR